MNYKNLPTCSLPLHHNGNCRVRHENGTIILGQDKSGKIEADKLANPQIINDNPLKSFDALEHQSYESQNYLLSYIGIQI